MADGIRPEPAVHRTAGSRDFDDPLSSVKSPPGPPDDHWWSDGPAHAWPTRSAGSRENPVADIGVSPWTGAELCRQAVWRFICATTRVVLGGRPRLLGRAWSAECNDRPRMNLGRQQAGAAQQQRQFPLTSQ